MNAFDSKLASLAEIGVRIGVNLQPNQELIVSAPLEASPLVRHVARCAYESGARLVTCLYDDPELIGCRLRHAPDQTLDCAPKWQHRGVADAMTHGAARLYIVGPYPDLLSGVSPERIVRLHKALASATRDEGTLTSAGRINWSTLPYVTDSWAAQVFPGAPTGEAVARLWQVVFDVTRVASGNPREAWAAHIRALGARREFLQARGFDALRFQDGRTDLTIGLAPAHRWVGGAVEAANGVACVCNIPTEEIFTCPDRLRAEGRLVVSRPLALGGDTVGDLVLDFADGAVTRVHASSGQAIVEALLRSDDGARRLGEVGLVPRSSPLTRPNVLFYSALFDENAASHVALGRSYAATVSGDGGPAGSGRANDSSIHLDLMFGSESMHVDGISGDGSVEAVMRDGEFAF